MRIITKVMISRFAEKQIERLPDYISDAFADWIETVEEMGIRYVRRLPGYHDEPLKGRRLGERSVRLNRSYRVFYIETVEEIEITGIEVNKHDY